MLIKDSEEAPSTGLTSLSLQSSYAPAQAGSSPHLRACPVQMSCSEDGNRQLPGTSWLRGVWLASFLFQDHVLTQDSLRWGSSYP